MAISRILSQHFAGKVLGMIIHLTHPAIAGRALISLSRDVVRRYPRINRAGCPSSVLSCTAWGFSYLANYSTSGELLPRLFTLACSEREAVSFPYISKNRRCVFCDTFRQRNFSTAPPAYFTRHAAVWCSDFPPANRKRFTSDHLPSATNLSQRAEKKRATHWTDITDNFDSICRNRRHRVISLLILPEEFLSSTREKISSRLGGNDPIFRVLDAAWSSFADKRARR